MSAAAHTFSGYVPRLLLQRLASGAPFEGPEARRRSGAILLSDIEGSTALIESFSGSAGLEEITWALNGYFAELVDIVYAHGGDVLYIAGDAFLCYWPAEHEDLVDATLRAAQAGLAIQAALHGRQAGRERAFSTRIGIGAGEVVESFLGGAGGRWQLVATGKALRDAIEAERSAAGGEVALAEEAWRLIAHRCDAHEAAGALTLLRQVRLPPARALLSFPPALSDPTILRPFVPESVLDRLLVPQTEWLAERRNVTVLLADLPMAESETGAEQKRAQASIRAFQEIVARFEGSTKVVVDDKGVLLLAVFGLPPFAHETDAERAIEAALALEQALGALDVTCGIGIATGHGLCGAFGNDVRRDYMLRGDCINLAARLMHASRGEILCDLATTRAVRERIRFEPREALLLKGKSEPVAVFRPLGRSDAMARQSGLIVGRNRERDFLAAELDALKSGAPCGLIVVEGDAGLGKSRLLQDVGDMARDAGLAVLTAAADPIEQSTAYAAWRGVYRSIFGIENDDDGARDAVLARATALGPVARLAPLLAGVLRIAINDNELTREMSGDARAASTLRICTAVLRHVADAAPTVLLVEDAHWLDASSWALLIEAARNVERLLIVVATRPADDWAAPRYAELLQLAGTRKLVLEGLTPEETAELIRLRLDVTAVPAALAAFVQDRVAGHPFFCEELLKAMRDRGAVAVENGQCRIGDLAALDLPITVEGVILSRLDRLSPRQQLCLKVASVIGRAFREQTVRAVHPIGDERPQVPGHLASLSQRGLIHPDPAPEASYLFAHALTRDVTYEMMPLVQRRPLHAAVASWHEHFYADDPAPWYAVLAWHWSRAAEPARTIDYLEKAAQQALRAGAFHDAHRFFSDALALTGEVADIGSTRRALWESGVGSASYYLGDMHGSRLRFEAALALLDTPVPASEAGAMRGVLSSALTQLLHRLFPRRFDGRKQADKEIFDTVVDAYTKLGQIYFLEGASQTRVLYTTLRGLNLGEEAGPSPALARILTNVSVMLGFLARARWSDYYHRRAVAIAGSPGNQAAAAYVHHLHAYTEAQRGRWAAAKATNAAALELIERLGDRMLEAEARIGLATLLLHEGNIAEARGAVTRIHEVAERDRNLLFLCVARVYEIEILLFDGKVDRAAELLDVTLAMPTAESDATAVIYKHVATHLTRAAQGRWAEAVAAADAIFEMLSHQSLAYYWVDLAAVAAETYVEASERGGDWALAHGTELHKKLDKACGTLKRLSRTFWQVRPRMWLLHGMAARLAGRRERAIGFCRKALAIARETDRPFEAARAILELARLGAASAPDIAWAIEVCRGFGAAHLLRGEDDIAPELSSRDHRASRSPLTPAPLPLPGERELAQPTEDNHE